MTPLLILLSLHLVADFVLQSNWMAMGKSKRWEPLTAHVGVYSTVVTVGMLGWSQRMDVAAWFWLTTFVTHWLTDYCTSRLTSRLWFIKITPCPRSTEEGFHAEFDSAKRHWFFVAIGFDQLIHAWTLALTWQWLAG